MERWLRRKLKLSWLFIVSFNVGLLLALVLFLLRTELKLTWPFIASVDDGFVAFVLLLIVLQYWRGPRRRSVAALLFLLCYVSFSGALLLYTRWNPHWVGHSLELLVILYFIWLHYSLLKKYAAADRALDEAPQNIGDQQTP
jgi:hypothetical protein